MIFEQQIAACLHLDRRVAASDEACAFSNIFAASHLISFSWRAPADPAPCVRKKIGKNSMHPHFKPRPSLLQPPLPPSLFDSTKRILATVER